MSRIVFLTSTTTAGRELRWQMRGLASRGIPLIDFSRGSRVKKILEQPTLVVMDPAVAGSPKGRRLIAISEEADSNIRVLVATPNTTTSTSAQLGHERGEIQ